MKLAISNDHGGVHLKKAIYKYLVELGHEVEDVGVNSDESVDYPDYSRKVTKLILNKEADLGILICGTGIGMSIAANRNKGIRAAVVGDVFSAKATKEHNNANIICLGERVTGEGLALMIVETWLNADFQGGRHSQRISKIESDTRNL
ncbi:ribose 5-phosphate isomerase B [Enterococcus olivae]